MVRIKNIESLNVDFKITDLSYNVDAGEVTAIFSLSVSVKGLQAIFRRRKEKTFKVTMKAKDVKKIKELFKSNREKLENSWKEIKNELKEILEISSPIDINLDKILQKLSETITLPES